MIAQQCDLTVGDLIWSGASIHIYKNHVDQVRLQLTRQPFPLPEIVITRTPPTIFDYKFEDFQIKNYQHHPHIAAPVAV